MSARSRPMSDLLFALTGAIVWSGHFFAVYFTEALLCSTPKLATAAQIRWIGGGLTAIALAALVAFLLRHLQGFRLSAGDDADASDALSMVAGPLTMLSMLAVLWTALPLFFLPACAPGGG
jgi:hypothetical protein